MRARALEMVARLGLRAHGVAPTHRALYAPAVARALSIVSMVAEPPLPSPLDAAVSRLGTDSRKMQGKAGAYIGKDVVPLWVADMDFRAPQPVVAALVERAAHGIYGYTDCPAELEDVLTSRLRTVYGCASVEAKWFRWLPGLICGLNHAARIACPPKASGDGPYRVAIPTPIYAPFLGTPGNVGAATADVPLACRHLDGGEMYFDIDWSALEAELSQPQTTLLQWCNPHNPVGRCWTREDLSRVATLCVEHNVLLCSDEVWGEMPLAPDATPFISMLSLLDDVPGLSDVLMVLTSPSKVFNVASLDVAVAVIPSDSLRRRFRAAGSDSAEVTCFGYSAATAAYTDPECEEWRRRLVTYLKANRDHAAAELEAMGLRFVVPEASYLLWIDATDALPAGTSAVDFFEANGVGLTGGVAFGGERGTCRLNFGCTRATLDEGLRRMRAALEAA